MKDDDYIGDRFQELTKYSRHRISGGARREGRDSQFKEYEGKQAIELGRVELPESGLWKALLTRRSRRNFSDVMMSRDDFTRLVFAGQGATARAGSIILRTAPSAGALYPVETYVVVNRVDGMPPGVYHYNLIANSLERLREGDFGGATADAALGQMMCAKAAAVFVFTGIPGRSQWKYAQRAWRYIYIDAGHICENLHLAAEDLGLGLCAIGAFFDEEMNAIIGVDGQQETVIYLAACGPLKPGREEQ